MVEDPEQQPATNLGFREIGSAAATAAEARRFHVLAVDDSLIDRKLIERLLKVSSFRVTTVESGSKALEFLGLHGEIPKAAAASVAPFSRAKEMEVNLIITDYCMPSMSGYDLLMRIKSSSSLKDIPVVVMSSENVPSRINRCLEGGAEEFILKPVQLSDMKRLRPHTLKGKLEEQQEDVDDDDDKEENEEEEEEQGEIIITSRKRKRRKAIEEGFFSSRDWVCTGKRLRVRLSRDAPL